MYISGVNKLPYLGVKLDFNSEQPAQPIDLLKILLLEGKPVTSPSLLMQTGFLRSGEE